MLNDLKAKLPLGKKPKGDDEESDEIEERLRSSREDATDVTDISETDDDLIPVKTSFLDQLKAKFSNSGKDKDDSDEASAEKQKRSRIIQIAIGAALILFIFSDEILPPEDNATPEVKLKERPRPNKKPEENTAPAVTEETPKTEETSVQPTDSTPAVTETTPDSPVEVTSSEVPHEGTDSTPAAVETTPSEVISSEPVVQPDTGVTVETPPSESSIDIIDGEQSVTKSDEDLTDQILQDLEKQTKTSPKPVEQTTEYVSPPDYEYRGRGLVYNCQGKHWACVDAPSYKVCERNDASVKYLKKKPECYPFNIYETVRGCEMMQNRMVSSSAKTAFCNE